MNFDINQETQAKLELFAQLLLKWNQSMNLIGKSTEVDIWKRHVLDSLQLLPFVKDKSVLDIGTGAGFPGIVLSIAGNNKMLLVEKSAKKCAFLNKVKAEIGGNFEILNERIEDIELQKIDIITCRAFASIKKILELTYRFVSQDTKIMLLKGENYEKELKEAQDYGWRFTHESIPSITNKESVILILSEIKK